MLSIDTTHAVTQAPKSPRLGASAAEVANRPAASGSPSVRGRTALPAIALALGVVLGPGAASAEPASASGAPAPPVAAEPAATSSTPEALFDQANEAYKAGRLAEAEALYRQAYAAKPSFDIGANLARVLLDGKRFAEAAELLARVIAELPPSVGDAMRARLDEALAEAAREALELKIQVNLAGAVVRVDGREVGRSPLAHRVFAEPGEHTVEASAEGHDRATRRISGAAGAAAEAVLALTPSARGGSGASADDGLPVSPVVVGAVLSAVLFGVGGAMLAVSSGQKSDADDRRDALSMELSSPDHLCPEAQGCAELDADYETARSSEDASTGLFVAGGVMAAATLGYLIAWAASGDSDAGEGQGDRAARLLPVPIVGPTAAGVGMVARF